MTSLQRYLATVHNEPVHFLPRVPILMGFAAQYIGSNYGAFASDYRVLVEANLRCRDDFGFDQVSAISDPYRETQGFGAEIEFVSDGVPRCLTIPLGESRDLSALLTPDPYTSERMRDRIKAVQSFKEQCAGDCSILGWVEGPAAEAADLRGVTNFLMDLYDEPQFACDLMDRCIEVGIAFGKAQIKEGADTIGIGDAIASQLSPATYGEFVFPRERRLVEALHKAGGLVRLHICGDTTHLLPYFAQLGADIIDLDWQVDMAKARATCPPGTVLTGNLDPANAVLKGTPEAIEQGLRDIYTRIGNPYMTGAGCEIPMGTPNANLKALCAQIEYRK